MAILKIHSIDSGFCRIYYKTNNQHGQKILYCLQDEGGSHGGIKLYRCTEEGEPSHEVSFKNDVYFELPSDDHGGIDYGEDKLKALCHDWIMKNAKPLSISGE